MNIKTISLVITFSLLVCSAFAQQQVVYLLKNNGKQVLKRDSADYVRVVTKDDTTSNLYSVVESYKSGKPKTVGRSSKIPNNVWEGEVLFFYPTGKKHWVANYKNGRLLGKDVEYYPNGVVYWEKEYLAGDETPNGNSVGRARNTHILIKACNDSTGKALLTNGNGKYIGYSDNYKFIAEQGYVKAGERVGQWTGTGGRGKDSVLFKEQYDNGKLTSGVSFDRKGNNYSYTERETMPEFVGGEAAFGAFLRDNVRYPKIAKENNVTGRVFITFVVDRDGRLVDMKAVRSPSADLANESMRVMNLSPAWTPGMQYGQPVRVQYTVPINFSLAQ